MTAQVNSFPVTFNGIDLTSIPGLTVLGQNNFDPPKRTLTIGAVARSNVSKVSSAFFTGKQISLRIAISALTRDLAEQSLDTLFSKLIAVEAQLVLRDAGELRSWTATYVDFVRGTDGGAYIEGSLVFETSDHYSYAIPYEKLLDATARTLYNYTDPLAVGGGGDTQAPIITAFISALTGGTTSTVTISNNATGRGIVVNRAWTAGDRLVIDCRNRTVKVNGTAVDFTGAFPEFASNTTGYMNYNDTFATRTLALSAYYNRRYL